MIEITLNDNRVITWNFGEQFYSYHAIKSLYADEKEYKEIIKLFSVSFDVMSFKYQICTIPYSDQLNYMTWFGETANMIYSVLKNEITHNGYFLKKSN